MICWSCEKQAGGGETCAGCWAIQPPDPAADHFTVLGVPRRHDLDMADVESRYKDLLRKLHPDRYTRADARARRAALGRAVQLTDAWRALRDPVRRAEYLVQLAGIDIGPEDGAARTGPPSAKARPPVPQALLMEMMELREELATARAAGDETTMARVQAGVSARVDAALAAVTTGLAGGGSEGLGAVVRELVALRYYRRLLEDIEAHQASREGE